MSEREYVVENGVPIPEIKHLKEHPGRWIDIVRKMKLYDSVLLDSRKEAVGLSSCIRERNHRQITRRVENGKYRVWLMDKKRGGLGHEDVDTT
jgi:hypothetical protein